MTLVREVEYDEVYGAQAHFRSLIDSMARPGKINGFTATEIRPVGGMSVPTALVAFALLNRDASYYCAYDSNELEAYLRVNTGSSPEELSEADFILVQGSDSPDLVELSKEGILTYPETGASFIIEVAGVYEHEEADTLQLRLSGPGVAGSRDIWVAGWQAAWVEALMDKNAEFPLGVDTILTFESRDGAAQVCCLPRSTKVEIV